MNKENHRTENGNIKETVRCFLTIFSKLFKPTSTGKLSISSWAAICKAFSFKCVPSLEVLSTQVLKPFCNKWFQFLHQVMLQRFMVFRERPKTNTAPCNFLTASLICVSCQHCASQQFNTSSDMQINLHNNNNKNYFITYHSCFQFYCIIHMLA